MIEMRQPAQNCRLDRRYLPKQHFRERLPPRFSSPAQRHVVMAISRDPRILSAGHMRQITKPWFMVQLRLRKVRARRKSGATDEDG
jgi:hypothetical protein